MKEKREEEIKREKDRMASVNQIILKRKIDLLFKTIVISQKAKNLLKKKIFMATIPTLLLTNHKK